MPKGDRCGSTIIIPAVKDARGRTVVPEKIYARKRTRDPATGKVTEQKRRVGSRTEAQEKRVELAQSAKEAQKLAQAEAQRPKTFTDLLDYFREHYAKPAHYQGSVKTGGYRSIGTVTANLKVLEEHFRDRRLRSITYEDLLAFKKKRLQTRIVFTKTKRTKRRGEQRFVTSRERAVASVHRELQLLRRLFNLALKMRPKWIDESPFHHGDPLIHIAAEPSRMRILTRAEERKLIECCFGPREHLAPAIIFALETAVRENEQFGTTVEDVDLAAGVIMVRRMSDNKKRVFDRLVPISDQLRPVLEQLLAGAVARSPLPSSPLFEYRELKRSFHTALRLAGIEGMRWHDLRHTAITWMVAATGDAATVMKISGHTQWRTFLRYVNVNAELVRGVADKMNARRDEGELGGGTVENAPLRVPLKNSTASHDDDTDSRPA